MIRKFFAILLALGVLFTFDCKELMRIGKTCSMQILSESKKIPPCHKQKNTSDKKECNCKVREKAIVEKSEHKIDVPKVYTKIAILEKFFSTNTKQIFIFSSNIILNSHPIPLQFTTKTIRLLI